MRILVTGATGFVGRRLVPYLAEKGWEVSALLRETYGMGKEMPQALSEMGDRLHLIYGDLRNRQSMARAVEGAEAASVIHLAAAGVTDPFLPVEMALRHNVEGTLNLARACFTARTEVRQLIVARTPGERSAMNSYAASKAAAWNFCRMYARTENWPIMGAMIFQAYGPGQPAHTLVASALASARAGEDFPLTSGRQVRDWIYLDDVVAGVTALVGTGLEPGTTVDLGTGQGTSVANVVRQIYELVDSAGEPLVGALPDRPGEVARQVADAERTVAVTGWRAKLSLREGLSRLAAQ